MKGRVSLMMETRDFVAGVVAGGVVGLVLGILYAPKSGSETRETIRRSAEDLCERARSTGEEIKNRIEGLADCGKKAFAVGGAERGKSFL